MSQETLRNLRIRVIIEGEVDGSEGQALPVSITRSWSFNDGSGSYQCSSMLYDSSLPLAGTSTTLDLDAQTDFKGQTTTDITGAKLMMFENLNTDPGNTLTIGGGDFSPMFADPSDKFKLLAGGFMLVVSPIDKYPEVAATGDGLLIANSATGFLSYLIGTTNT